MLRRTLVALVVLVAAAGCSSTPPAPIHTGGPANGPWSDAAPAIAAGKTGPGTACPQALTFDVPAGWKLTGDFTAAGGMTLGGLDLVCELDGKPAGVLGIMRVFKGPAGDLRAVGARYVADWAPTATEVEYRDAKIGPADGVEVSFRSDDHYTRDFLVASGPTVYLVDWGGLDSDAHAAGLPAYALARTSAVVTAG
jgi:hypothetical protein